MTGGCFSHTFCGFSVWRSICAVVSKTGNRINSGLYGIMSDATDNPVTVSPRSAWFAVLLLWIAYLINYVDRQTVFSIFPVFERELRLSSKELGLVGSVFAWIYALCMPLAGRCGDMFRRDRIVVASLGVWSLATLGTGLSRSFSSLLGWRAVMGVSEALYIPSALGLIAVLHTTSTRSRALALHGTAQFAGVVLGGWYGGWTAEHLGWRLGFAILAAAGLSYSFVLSKALPAAAPPRAKQSAAPSPFDILGSRCYLALFAAFFALCLMVWVLYGWLPDWIYEKYGLSMAASALSATIYLQAGSALGVLLGGVAADWLRKRVRPARFYVCAFGLFLCAPFGYLTLAADSLARLKIASGFFGLFGGFMIANIFASAYDVVRERNYAFAAGVLNLGGGIASGAGLLLAGWWKESGGVVTLMQRASIASVFAALLLASVAALRFDSDVARLSRSR
ncbi:MAG: MFS transporter [Terriglobia bacterium]